MLGVGRFADGDYRIAVEHAGIWPALEPIHFDGSEDPIPLQLRRLGELHVVVKSAAGAALSGLAASLTSRELGSSVDAWMQQGLVPGDASDLVTGPTGALFIRDLPRAPYCLRLTLPGGAISEHEVIVAPGAAPLVEIHLGS